MSMLRHIASSLLNATTSLLEKPIKSAASNNPTFRKSIINLAREHNNIINRMDKKLEDAIGLESATNLMVFDPLKINESKAVETGAKILARGLMFMAASLEVWYQIQKDAKKKAEKRDLEWENLHKDMEKRFHEIEAAISAEMGQFKKEMEAKQQVDILEIKKECKQAVEAKQQADDLEIKKERKQEMENKSCSSKLDKLKTCLESLERGSSA